ncbi:MAG: MBL fold metallo-hydrolase [Lachnospiraceae bacterium]|nr:MBL fold metallo-hydrolase [Lachnospiraceae bacterium]MBP5254496.1 MBL fold metallo-hydrolase [Lachnospiraceae bacterium]
MRFKALASGSNGNCVYCGSGNTHILVDCGISAKRVTEGLKELGVRPEKLTAILVTHEHTDHICGLPVFLKHFPVPVFGTAETLYRILGTERQGAIVPGLLKPIEPGKPFAVGDFMVSACPVSHDAARPVAYRMASPGGTAAVMTDLGTYTAQTEAFLRGVNALLLESNHDIRMLETGRYPYVLKRRILSDFGHLSNGKSSELLERVIGPDLRFVLLGHISEENNYPDLALLEATNMLETVAPERIAPGFRIECADRHAPSSLFEM